MAVGRQTGTDRQRAHPQRGGWGALKSLGKGKRHLKGDERLLRDSDFVEAVLEARNEKLERRYRIETEGFDIERAIKRAAEISGLSAEHIRTAGKQPLRVQARSLSVTGRWGNWV